MNGSLADKLDRVERKPLKCGAGRPTESFVRAGQLVDQAIAKAHLTKEQAADEYGVTPSLLARQLTNQDNQHLSFQRLWSMSDDFKREFLEVLAKDVQGVEVITEVRIRRTA